MLITNAAALIMLDIWPVGEKIISKRTLLCECRCCGVCIKLKSICPALYTHMWYNIRKIAGTADDQSRLSPRRLITQWRHHHTLNIAQVTGAFLCVCILKLLVFWEKSSRAHGVKLVSACWAGAPFAFISRKRKWLSMSELFLLLHSMDNYSISWN